MLARKSADNQLTLPKAIADLFPDADSFDVEVENGRIILKPIQLALLEEVRGKIATLGITKQDIQDAIAWARGTKA